MRLISESEFQAMNGMHNRMKTSEVDSKADEASEVLFNEKIPEDIKLRFYSGAYHKLTRALDKLVNHPTLVKLVENDITETEKKNANLDTEKKDKPIVHDVVKKQNLDENDFRLLSLVPESHREKCELLMRFLKHFNELIHWDSKGEVTFTEIDKARGSNIVDLCQYVLRTVKWPNIPVGANRFMNVLCLTNAPVTLFNLKIRQELTTGLSKPHGKRESISKRQIRNWEAQSPMDQVENESEASHNDQEIEEELKQDNSTSLNATFPISSPSATSVANTSYRSSRKDVKKSWYTPYSNA